MNKTLTKASKTYTNTSKTHPNATMTRSNTTKRCPNVSMTYAKPAKTYTTISMILKIVPPLRFQAHAINPTCKHTTNVYGKSLSPDPHHFPIENPHTDYKN